MRPAAGSRSTGSRRSARIQPWTVSSRCSPGARRSLSRSCCEPASRRATAGGSSPQRDTWIGILPVGYADGFRRDLTGTEVLVDGERRPRRRDGLDGRDRRPARSRAAGRDAGHARRPRRAARSACARCGHDHLRARLRDRLLAAARAEGGPWTGSSAAPRFRLRAQPSSPRVLDQFLALRGDERALDVGAGLGALAFALAPRVGEVVSVDIDEALVERARASAPPNVEVLVGDAEHLPFGPFEFDLSGSLARCTTRRGRSCSSRSSSGSRSRAGRSSSSTSWRRSIRWRPSS